MGRCTKLIDGEQVKETGLLYVRFRDEVTPSFIEGRGKYLRAQSIARNRFSTARRAIYILVSDFLERSFRGTLPSITTGESIG